MHFAATRQTFGHAVVIPSYGEGAGLWKALESIPQGTQGPVLTILVINARDDSSKSVLRENKASLDVLDSRLEPSEPHMDAGARFYRFGAGRLLVVHRSPVTTPLPPKQGVGLARKIGADIALACNALGSLRSQWIHCTDADVRLPLDYFAQIDHFDQLDALPDTAAASACTYPFRHHLDGSPRQRRAIAEYETSLRYYVVGLRYANSPYAFHTIGSTLAVRADAYAQVRGFPRRNAAEDFYLLNKLAKVGSIQALTGDAIELSGRISDRVPFGTGRAIQQALAGEAASERRTYDPRLFTYLRGWVRALDALAAEGASGKVSDRLVASTHESIGKIGSLDPETLIAALDATDSLRIVEYAARQSTDARLRRDLHEAFDGHRTLKLLHALRDAGLPDLALSEAVRSAPFQDATHLDTTG